MKYLAIIVTLALFSVMGYFIWEQRNESTSLKNELELLRRQQNPALLNERELEIARLESQLIAQQRDQTNLPASAAPAPTQAAPTPTQAPATAAATIPTPAPINIPAGPAPAQDSLPPLNPPPVSAAAPSPSPALSVPAEPPAPPPLTVRQRQILGAPAIGKITEYQQDYGFVVINANASMNVETSMTFAIRRGHDIIGRIKVTAVDEGGTIADIIGGSVPPGVTIAVGDDVIQDLP